MSITSFHGHLVATIVTTTFNPFAGSATRPKHSERAGAKKFQAPGLKTARVD